MKNIIQRWSANERDEGLGLVEVVVAMFLLALVALALLPLLITGMNLAVANTTLAAATQLANDRMTAAQSSSPDCDRVKQLSIDPVTTTDARGVVIRAETTVVGDCPDAGASTVRVETVVSRVDTGDELASASTLVLVAVAP